MACRVLGRVVRMPKGGRLFEGAIERAFEYLIHPESLSLGTSSQLVDSMGRQAQAGTGTGSRVAPITGILLIGMFLSRSGLSANAVAFIFAGLRIRVLHPPPGTPSLHISWSRGFWHAHGEMGV